MKFVERRRGSCVSRNGRRREETIWAKMIRPSTTDVADVPRADKSTAGPFNDESDAR